MRRLGFLLFYLVFYSILNVVLESIMRAIRKKAWQVEFFPFFPVNKKITLIYLKQTLPSFFKECYWLSFV